MQDLDPILRDIAVNIMFNVQIDLGSFYWGNQLDKMFKDLCLHQGYISSINILTVPTLRSRCSAIISSDMPDS